MNQLKKATQWVKEHPWETAFTIVSVALVAQTINAGKAAKVANHNGMLIEQANGMMEMLAHAIKEGYEIIVDDEYNIMDIIYPALEVSK